MENLLKKIFFTSIGFASLATEKFKKAIDELVADGKLSEEEGKKKYDEFIKSTAGKKDELQSELDQTIEKIIGNFAFATQDDIKKMENKISDLEKLLNEKQSEKES